MAEKRRGLGRGLGALIPNTQQDGKPAANSRPVDLFFPVPTESPSEAAQQEVTPPVRKRPRASSVLLGEPVDETAESPVGSKVVDDTPSPSATDVSRETSSSASASTASASTRRVPRKKPETVVEAVAQAELDTSEADLLPVPGAEFADLDVTLISPNPRQPRTEFDEQDMAELVHSIREIGVLQPIVVRRNPEVPGTFELIMGERRWRASQEAGQKTVPAIIRETSDNDLLRDALLENLHRSQLNPIEEAAAYQQLLEDFGTTHEELADRIGRSRPQVSNTIRLLKLPPLVQRRVAAGVLSAGHARALLGLPDGSAIERLAQRIVAEGLSVRATEEAVVLYTAPEEPKTPREARNTARHERLDYLASSLADRLDTNVKITLGARKGRVSIEFASVDDLNRIMDVINPNT